MKPGLLLPLGCVLLLLTVAVHAGASGARKDAAAEFPGGNFSGTQMTGAAIGLKVNESAPGAWTGLGGGPPPRSGFGLAFDRSRGLLVLFGGENDTEWFNDTWTYNVSSGTWTEMKPAVSPPGRSRTAMVYDSTCHCIVLFGGYVAMAPSRNDTWAYDAGNNTWTDMKPSIAPPGRYAHAMAYDTAESVTVLFGGKTGPEENDTWTYDLRSNSWTNRTPGMAPPNRMSHSMCYDIADGSTILFGGYGGGGMMNDTWSYNLTDNKWTRKGLSGGPDPRENHAMDYDQLTGLTVLFGGWSYDNPDKNDTWVYDAGKDQWTGRSPSLAPSARSWHRMVSDPGRGVLLLFGGLQTFPHGFMGDLWMYDPAGYVSAGTYTSRPFDAGGKAYYAGLEWNATLPVGTSVKFRLRTADSFENLGFSLFLGPDGTPDTYYEASGRSIHYSHNGSRMMQYRAYLATNDTALTPLLGSVAIPCNLLHNLTLLSPVGGEMWSGKHNISWGFSDPDGNKITFDLYLQRGLSIFSPLATGLSGTSWEWDTEKVWRGTVKIKLVARDDDLEIPLSVIAISGDVKVMNNHPPAVALATPADGSSMGSNLTLAWTGSDEDGDPVTYSVYLSDSRFDSSTLPFPRANTNETSLAVSDLVLNRTYFWAVLPNDGLERGPLSEVRRFTVNSTVGNRPPRITTSPGLDAVAGQEYVYLPEAVDDDHDPLEFTLARGVTGMTLNPSTHRIIWTPEPARAGEDVPILLRVTDGRGGAAEQDFIIHVSNPRPGCRITSPGDGELVRGRVNITGNATKAISSVLSVDLRIDGGEWYRVCGTYIWSYGLDTAGLTNGEHRLEVRAYDGKVYSDIEAINLRVANPELGVTLDGYSWWFPLFLTVSIVLLVVMVVMDVWRDRPWKNGHP